MNHQQIIEHHNHLYTLKDEINRGAFGTVYEAHCRKLNKRSDEEKKIVAVKIVNVHDTNRKNDALYEAQIQRQLRSIPNVIHLFDFFVYDGKAHFVQQLAYGGDVLDRLMEKKRYREKDAKKLARNLITTIRALHNRGIVHRDLKPENLLLKEKNDDTKIMLCDFGDAYKFSAEDIEEDDKLYTVCGTPAFMAPEILQRNGYRGKEVDMWSIGCIIFLLIGGYAPFGYDQKRAFERSCKADYQFGRNPWITEVSSNAMNLISKLLKVDPIDRLTASETLNSRWFCPSSTREIKKKASSSLNISATALSSKMLKTQQSQKALFQQRKHPSIAVGRALNNRQRI